MSASASGITQHAATIALAAPGDRIPAAIGRNGLLTLSISTSVIWLIPTIAMFTVSPARSVNSRSYTGGAVSSSATAIAYSPSTDSAVPMIVCGREKRHSTMRRVHTTGGRGSRHAALPTRGAGT